ncbi:glycosyl transferase [Arthrobacter sp. MYb224]|uniref:glycosyltransferase family 2 protein n=1 Tax=Arthrobacter sp. MYb224 TaxID=1848600 RepID=UPI000CFD8963|nr:glycosyltransferase family 2 protein [Arthrobacter sp. MYb224]PQZ97006.1 glycosyl transferase [Arthrobacter sp. MYb224]
MLIIIIALAVTVVGLTTILWSTAGLLRLVTEVSLYPKEPARGRKNLIAGRDYPDYSQVAVLIAAHNEELVIAKTLQSVLALLPATQIFVASDGSTDKTAGIVRSFGAQVISLNPNRGKAGALAAAVEHFQLDSGFEVVMLLDADTQLSPDYFSTGLPQFADPQVVAVAGRARTIFDPAPATLMGKVLVAYRERLYQFVQVLVKYGQAAKKANVVNIVPGFASMYRARILPEIDIAAEGLTIEDFNMTFEVHAKKLGRVAFHPGAAVAYTQDPDNLGDYINQVRRWTLGYWQTVRRHGLHIGKFWAVQALYIVELVSCSLFFLLLLPALLVSAAAEVALNFWADPNGVITTLSGVLPPYALLLGLLIPELLLTLFAVVMTRRMSYLWMAPLFPFLRVVDSYLCIATLIRSLRSGSTGIWNSPTRRFLPPAISDQGETFYDDAR